MDAPSMEADFELDAFSEFLAKYPAYKDTMIIDSLRREEYPHLDKKGQACLDYTGVGLFSGSQIGQFGLECCHMPSNLATHAMYAEDGSTESYFRKRVLHYLNLNEEDYYIVFTANAFSAFKLLGTAYPFHEAPNLLLAYDHKCENVGALSDCCLSKSGCVHSVALSWPWCRVDAHDLEKKLHCKKKVCMHKGGSRRGLFAFPYSSRVTGCRSSSRWISQAQQNGWHVLLDVTSIDAKILDSLGLSLFLPEFVICSFYNVFGEDPTGLGCLAVKKSVLRTLGDSSRARAIGMVTIMIKQPSLLVPSGSYVSVDDDVKHKHSAPSQNSAGFSDPSDSKKSSMHQPEWSADLTAIDNTWFYQSNGDDFGQSNGALHEVAGKADLARRSVGNDINWSIGELHEVGGIGDAYANPAQSSHDHEKGVPDKDMVSHDGMVYPRGSLNASVPKAHRNSGCSSFSVWMDNQGAPKGASFRSISARECSERDFNFPSTSYGHMGSGRMWQNEASEIEEFEPYASYSNSRLANGQARAQVYSESLKRRSSKGLFHRDVDAICTASRTSLRRLFKYETKAKIREHFQKAGQAHLGAVSLTVHDWVTYYAEKARLLNSASSSASSSYRFGTEGEHDREILQRNAFVHNKITCKGLDHADLLGYKRVAVRLRSLAEWLISALSRLHHPPPACSKLVKFCSRRSLAERASTVAFSLADSLGNPFDVKRVQLLADRSNISLRTGIIEGVFIMELLQREQHHEERSVGCMELSGYKCLSKDGTIQRLEIPVLYVSLGFLNNFSDVYRLWRFVCKFLDPLFVKQELWHYQALNQETIEI
ncbi:hypothetical protein L7F22_031660 [Adiantum nelumboides]|nr:hypothetical protein [Adiantum nelumboides]